MLYRTHGLTISSELALPELRAGVGEPQVCITRGTVPRRLAAPVAVGLLFEATPDQFLLRVDGVARYWVRDGREIIVDVDTVGDVDGQTVAIDVRTLLLGPVLTTLLHQRGSLVMHAAAVVGVRGAVLIAGWSGSGKSTLVASLAKRGFRFLTDDAAVIFPDADGRLSVQPGPPYVKLWEDAVMRLGDVGALVPVRQHIKKFAVRFEGAFADRPEPIVGICVLEPYSGERPEAEAVSDASRFRLICAHTHRFQMLVRMGQQGRHFPIAALAARLPMTVLRRPRRAKAVDLTWPQLEDALQ